MKVETMLTTDDGGNPLADELDLALAATQEAGAWR